MSRLFESDRLFFRYLQQEDAPSFFELNNNPNVLRYTGDDAFSNIEKATSFLTHYQYNKGMGRYAVIRKSDNTFIGWCGPKLNSNNLIDLGFRFFEQEWNKGYATEAAMATIEYCFNTLEINSLIARANSENIGSIRVIEKCNFIYTKTEPDGELGDTLYYTLSNSNIY